MITTHGCKLDKVAVLMGGRSAEREISLASGTGVLEALRSKGVNAHAFDPAERSIFALKQEGFTSCFIALHGRFGEDGTVQGALELMEIPYTGPGVAASSVAMDKVMTKRLWQAGGISTPDYVQVASDDINAESVLRVIERLGLPMIVKPPHEGSSIGVFKAENAAGVEVAMRKVAEMDHAILCEEFIVGDELTCPLIGSGAGVRALPIIQIMPPNGNYDYENKYFTDAVRYECPARLDEKIEGEIRKQVLQAYSLLGCRGWSRIDVMVRASDKQPFLLEINTSPGMTGHSLVPMSAQAVGISYADLCLMILESATLDNAASLASV